MKTKTLIAFTLKAILILTFTKVGLSGFTKCDAQSIVGKWKDVSGKDFRTAKGVKVTGKQFLPQASQIGGQVLEIRADHTFTSSELMTWVPSSVKLTGTWTLSGDQLNTKLDLHQPDPINNPTKETVSTIYTITINGNYDIEPSYAQQQSNYRKNEKNLYMNVIKKFVTIQCQS